MAQATMAVVITLVTSPTLMLAGIETQPRINT